MQAWTQNRLNGRTKERWECEELLPKEHVQSVNRRVPKVLVIVDLMAVVMTVGALLGNAEIAARFRDVYLVPLHGSVVAMVTVVRNLPAEVRRPQQGVDRLGRPNTLAAASKPFRGDNNTRHVRSQSSRTRIGSRRRRHGHTADGSRSQALSYHTLVRGAKNTDLMTNHPESGEYQALEPPTGGRASLSRHLDMLFPGLTTRPSTPSARRRRQGG